MALAYNSKDNNEIVSCASLHFTLLTSQAVGRLSVDKIFSFPAVGKTVERLSVLIRVGIDISSGVSLGEI